MQSSRRLVFVARTRLSVLAVAGTLFLGHPTQAATFNYLPTPVEIGPSAASTWEDVNVSGWVPAGATGVIIQYVATGTSEKYGVRKNGSTDTWMSAENTAYVDTIGFLMTGVDAGRVLEIYEDDTAIKTYLIGYTMEGVTFFTNAVDKSLSTTGSYEDIDISGDTGTDTAIGAILTVQNMSSSDSYAIRKNGSTDDRYDQIKNSRSTSCLIGVDAGEICEMKIASTVIDAYLVGYVTSGAVFFTNGVDKSTDTTGSYRDVDITADIGSDDANGAILQVFSDDGSSQNFGIRKNGASYDYYGLTKNEWAFTAIDAGDVFEQRISDTHKDLYLIGYTLAVSPPTISSASNQSFFVGDSATAISTVTVTDSEGGLITAANDIRIRIPAGFNMVWDSADTTATIGGAASSKVDTTVTYEDSDATLVLNVTSAFAAGDAITVSDVSFKSFTAVSSVDSLGLEVNNDGVVTATDDKTIAIGAPTYRSIGTDSGDLYSVGTASTTAGSAVVTFTGATLPANVGQGDKLTLGGGGPSTLFSDNFTDGVITGWTDIGTDPMEESSGIFQTPNGVNSDSHYSVDAGASWTDYTFSADVMANDDDMCGITFRVQDGSNYYLLRQTFGDTSYGTWNLVLQKVVGGSATDLAAPVDNGGQVNSETTWYTFKVELSGTSIKAYVDDVLKFDVTDSTYASGTAGLYLEADRDGQFDNALVTGGGAGAEFYVLSRDSDTQVTLQAVAGSTLTNKTYTFERCYNTMQAWEDDSQGDLVTDGRRAIGVCYNDGAFTDRLVISGSTTDAAHYMKLTVAEGQRHNGDRTGAVLDAEGGWTAQNAIDVEDEYTRIEWLRIMAIHDAGDGISFANSPSSANGLVSNVYVHSFWQANNAAVRVDAPGVTIRNCFVTGGTSYGVRIEASGSATIENCTLWGYSGGGYGVHTSAGDVALKNTISVDHGSLDVYIETGGTATISYFGYNMFSTHGGGFDPNDVAYAGNNQLPPANLEFLFVSISNPEDLHLESSGHRAGNTGLDLSSSFSDDIDGATRSGVWDIGADETVTGTEPLTPKILAWQEVEP